ncbi:MAG: translocation/assembly module TamB domain-containing protein [Ginsengibacter sp.]
METKTPTATHKKSIWIRILKVFGWIIASIIFLLILVAILIQIPSVQNYGRQKVVSYLQNKLHTKVEIGKLAIKFPTSISLQNIFIEDQSKDTLLYGGELLVDISMFKLLKKDIEIQTIALDNITAKIKRVPPDSTFNFQFIVDAFMSPNKTPNVKDTTPLKINIDNILLNRTRVVYKDAYTGNDMDLAIGHFDTRIKTFDPSHMLFDIPTMNLKGLKGHFYQMEPLQKSIEKTVADAAANPDNFLQLLNKEINLSDINVVYKNEPSHLNTSFVIGDAKVHLKTLDLKNSIITLNDATLNNSAIMVETASALPAKVSKDTMITTPTPSMKIIAGDITINSSSLKFDDVSAPNAPSGMDYAHLFLKDLSIHAKDLQYSTDTILASIKSATLKDKSGFVLNKMHTDFAMNPSGVSLGDLLIETPGSVIQRSADISYPSLEAIKQNPGVLGLDIDLVNSKISTKDLAMFVPALAAQLPANATLYADARITGSVNNMNFQKLILKGLSATDINVTGVVRGLPETKNIFADLNIKHFKTSRKDIFSLVPKNTIPSTITIPESIAAEGKIKGGMANLYTELKINTSLGSAVLKGTLVNITDSNHAKYNMVVHAGNLQLGTLMKNPKLGNLTGDFIIRGSGLTPQTANATFRAAIPNITLNKYNYKNIKADGTIARKVFNINAAVHDPNLDFTLSANGNLNSKFPAIQFDATIDSIKTLPLHFTTNALVYHGKLIGDFTNTDPDNLEGSLFVTNSILVNNGDRTTIDSLSIVAHNSGAEKDLIVTSDFLSARLKGQYTLTQLGDVFQQAIDPYFALSATKNTTKVNPYHFSLEASVIDHPALRAFLPSLTELKPVMLTGNFASDSGWNMYMKAPHIVYGTNVINDVNFNAQTENGKLVYKTSIKEIKNGTALQIFATTLNGSLQNNVADFTLNVKDNKSVDKYTLSGKLSQPSANRYTFSLVPGNLLLNYEKWNMNADNSITYFDKDIAAHNFVLSKNGQELSINSTTTTTNSPLEIAFKNFKIETLTGFVQSDSLFVNGVINGNAVIKNIQVSPNFVTDLTVSDLSIYNDTIGTLTAKVNNNVANTYHAAITLNGNGNEVNINGDYNIKPDNQSTYDMVMDVVQFQMKSLEGFSKGAIRNARGFLYGKVAVKGTLKDPNIDGKINFNETSFNISQLNSVFRIDKEAIAIINNKGVEFNKFTIRDTTNNALNITGSINTTNFTDYKAFSLNMGIDANNFHIINSTKKDNKLFYGKFIFSTKLSIKGTPNKPVVDGDFTVNDSTDFTVVLPQTDQGIVDREGIVRFEDMRATKEDSLLMNPYDSLNVSQLVGYDVSVNINVSKNAVFNVIVDEGNGDFLRLKGTAQLNGGIDPSGKINLTGSYEIEEGSYDLSFNFIKRKFLMQKGSRIVWTGEPTTAQVDVTAIYVANTAPLDLVQQQTNGNDNIYKQKLPFEVHLSMLGELLKPVITFDIVLPTEKNYTVSTEVTNNVQARLIQLRQEPGEMNKQVFALLLLNRFVGENPFANSAGGSFDAASLAKQSVSKLLTQQLNNLADGLVQGVDINFDVATTEDYTTGSKQDRTDFNVGVSKSLLNDRLTVTVGSNFELEGPKQGGQQNNNVAGNININYKLSKDGRYALRAYRKNDYTGTIEGYVVETGIGFVLTVDYNKFSQIFRSKAQKRKRREIKKANMELEKKNAELKKIQTTVIPPGQEKEKENEK